MTPQQFQQKWGPGGPAFHLNEEQGAQSHFLDLCELLGVPKPGSEDGYLFEEKNSVIGGRTGYADVFRRGAFAWENKAPGKNLVAALQQLQTYSLALSNPPILVVCDRLTTRIYTQFNGHPTETHDVLLSELDQPEKLALLRRIWLDPESFRPKKTSRDITEAAAKSFATLAGQLQKTGHAPQQVSHFLTQCLFCFFAEDVGLLPDRMFEKIIHLKMDRHTPPGEMLPSEKLTRGLAKLFEAMRIGDICGTYEVIRFNGGLFQSIDVPRLNIMNVTELRNAANMNWSAIDVSIFGTLFERGLDPAKRSQLGAHYTDPATIMRIIEPVLQRPLLQIWEQVRHVIRGLMAKSRKKGDASYKLALGEFGNWLNQLKDYRVLDPACGSGNFLFLGLKTLKDIEHKSHLDAVMMGLDRQADLVTGPHNMLGIELNEYAAELARVTVWIGELQWRLTHGYEFKTDPVLEPLDNIECRDALLEFVPVAPHDSPNKLPLPLPLPLGEGRGEGLPAPRAIEAQWPKASVVIGNPPFLGNKKMRDELGEAYTRVLREVYDATVPGSADLVSYWFDKALKSIRTQGLGAAGLVATQSIRRGSSRAVLDSICQQSRIYEAWSDEPWVNDGAAVRVSLICFGWGGNGVILDGAHVSRITADLGGRSGVDLTIARPLPESAGVAFQGPVKVGAFDISGEQARRWLQQPNVNGQSSVVVLKPWANGQDIAKRSSDRWIIDFGATMQERDASEFEAPFAHVRLHVKPMRDAGNRERRRRDWWLHGETVPGLRVEIKPLWRFIATPRVAKHRYFVWLPCQVWPDSRLYVITRQDDVSFGVLSSRIHEVWSLANASMHGVGNDPTYNAKSCFETFPFPAGLTPADTAHQQTEVIEGGALIPAGLSSTPVRAELVEAAAENKDPSTGSGRTEEKGSGRTAGNVRSAAEAIARAAKRLNELREAWLNPPEWTQRVSEVIPLGMQTSPYPDRIVARFGHEKDLAERTLTKLYNQRPAWLAAAHQTLDAAVAAAYGWADYTADLPDEGILKRLLALNLVRSKIE